MHNLTMAVENLSTQDSKVKKFKHPSVVRWITALSLMLGCATLVTQAEDKDSGAAYKQQFTDKESLKEFVFSDPSAWRWTQEDDAGVLELHRQSKYKPRHRSPFNIALLADHVYGDFELEFEARQTGREYGHRDMCVIFGFQDASHYYYAHIATKADHQAHQIMIVDDKPRTSIVKDRTGGVDWGQNDWHKIRVVRKTDPGTVEVYFDDMEKPVLTAEHDRFKEGRIGFGSFDDTGMIRNVTIKAADKKAYEGKRDPFEAGRETDKD